MEFILGCNYWTSDSGTNMWREWDEKKIEKDFQILTSHGITHLRIFPNWRDFQPIIPIYSEHGAFQEFVMDDETTPCNKFWLSDIMMERLKRFCDLSEEYHIKLIVGLLTGWMCGRLFVPMALQGKNVYTDPVALLFEQRMVSGIVSALCKHPAIYAWDLGNECSVMSEVFSEEEATNWTGIIAHTIRAYDSEHPIVSGMHGLSVERNNGYWTITGQAEYNDMLTTHPYPFWVKHTNKTRILDFRTMMHATAETRMYADISEKPCLVEEIGTMGPMICSDDTAANFLRVNIWSTMAAGSPGLLWWCANDFLSITKPPFNYQMCELELGLLDTNGKPKKMLKEIKRASEILDSISNTLPTAAVDAVCILSDGQDQWAVAYMTYCMAKQAGLNISFCSAGQQLPESQLYLLPAVTGHQVMKKECYQKLLSRVNSGATLYISMCDGYLSGFKALTGTEIIDSCLNNEKGVLYFEDKKMEIYHERQYKLRCIDADILAINAQNEPEIVGNKYGKGKVIFSSFSLENILLNSINAFEKDQGILYRYLFKEILVNHIVLSNDPFVPLTYHPIDEKNGICVLINYSSIRRMISLDLAEGWDISQKLYGFSNNTIEAYDIAILLVSHK